MNNKNRFNRAMTGLIGTGFMLAVFGYVNAQGDDPEVIETSSHVFTRMAEGVYQVTGTGEVYLMSNAMMLVGDEDVLLVDSHVTPNAANALLRSVRAVTNKPVRYLVNTHYHFDHAHGNQVFPEQVEIIGHEYTRTKLNGELGNVLTETTMVSFTEGVPALVESLRAQLSDTRDPEERAALARRLPCDRLKLLPHQPRAGLARSLSLPDIHLVSLDPACEGLVLPSKIYGIVAAGRPILFLGDPLGPTARLIRELDLGIVLPVDRPDEALERLLSCLRGEITLPGESRLRAVHERILCRDHALARWSRILDGEPFHEPPEQRHAA